MANICLYKVKVKGTKKACYKLVNMMPLYSYEKEYLSEEGTDEDFTLIFIGDCKWSVDCYTTLQKDIKPFTEEEIDKIEDGDYWEYPLSDKSIALNCEIFCNSKDIDDACYSNYVHYNKGLQIFDECPKELHIKRGRDYDNEYDISIPLSSITNEPQTLRLTCKVKFEGGSYWYFGDYEIGDLVYVDGAKKGILGKVVEKSDSTKTSAIYEITEKIGHIGPFIKEDIEAIWQSYKVKDRKEYFKRIGLEENMTKNKFISVMEKEWTDFAQENDNWNKFLETLK